MLLKIILISATVLIAGMFVISGCAHRGFHRFGGGSPEKRAEFIVDKISDELDLTDPQKAKLNSIKDEVIAKHKSRKDIYEGTFNTLQSEIKKDKMDEKLLLSKLNEFSKDREEMHTFMVSKLVEFHSMLTDEQKQTLIDKMNDMKDRFQSFN